MPYDAQAVSSILNSLYEYFFGQMPSQGIEMTTVSTNRAPTWRNVAAVGHHGQNATDLTRELGHQAGELAISDVIHMMDPAVSQTAIEQRLRARDIRRLLMENRINYRVQPISMFPDNLRRNVPLIITEVIETLAPSDQNTLTTSGINEQVFLRVGATVGADRQLIDINLAEWERNPGQVLRNLSTVFNVSTPVTIQSMEIIQPEPLLQEQLEEQESETRAPEGMSNVNLIGWISVGIAAATALAGATLYFGRGQASVLTEESNVTHQDDQEVPRQEESQIETCPVSPPISSPASTPDVTPALTSASTAAPEPESISVPAPPPAPDFDQSRNQQQTIKTVVDDLRSRLKGNNILGLGRKR